jgi:hypothetical protein
MAEIKQKIFVLKQNQLNAFSDYMYRSFEKKAFLHLKKKFPVSTKSMTDDTLNSLIKNGINKAAKYNIVDRPDVLNFLEYLTYFGNDFDTDPSLPKLSKVLKIRNLKGAAKMQRIIKINSLKQEFI